MLNLTYLIEDDTSWDVYKIKDKYLSSIKNLRDFQRECEVLENDIILNNKEDLTEEKYAELVEREKELRFYQASNYKLFLQTLITEREKEKVADGLL